MSTVWEDIDGGTNQYKRALPIYLMTVLSSSYGIIMDHAINTTGYVNNFVDGINATEKLFEGKNGTYW